ncbi:MAG: MBL fold metallo-hydrolase [bacterium]
MCTAPELGEIEVSVFGPGYGESILLHVGNNDWLVIDSCIDLSSKTPLALNYLRQIGVDPSKAVKLIVATHWHDDHIRGLGCIVKECKSATFVCAEALTSREFLTLVEAYGTRSMMESSSGVKEFYEIIQVLKGRRESQRTRAIPYLKFACADKLLWRKEATDSGLQYPCSLYALSPSDATSFLSKLEIAKLLPHEKAPKRRILTQPPNYVAVVLLVEIGNIIILLGSDLEETTDPETGWSVIVNSRTRPQEKASLFKIPHHGSETAEQSQVWTEMLIKDPVTVLTPCIRGSVSIPTSNDVKRICSKSTRAYATASLKMKRIKRPKIVEEFIQQMVRTIQPVFSSSGHVRLRTKPNNKASAWSVDLFGDAVPLNHIYSILHK